LLINSEYGQVKLPTVQGVLTHSWSPWAVEGRPVPVTYEGQVVAIADQLASINHDTEDIIDGAIYTNHDFDRFYKDAQAWIKKRAKAVPDIDEKMAIFLNVAQPGYGRKRRVGALTAAVVSQALQMLESKKITSSAAAQEHPLILPSDWMIFLQSYERFIRERVVQRESWFVGRDAMAEALVSSVFNHIWPRFKVGRLEPQIEIWPKEDEAKGRIEEERLTIKHYSKFFDDDYAEKRLEEILQPARSSGIETWDCYLADHVPTEVMEARRDAVLRLISVIDFVAGLTDRYCLEIFDRVYHSFTV
jgi:dGTP triphosphohydrolase